MNQQTGAGGGGGRPGPSLREAFEDLETRFILNLPDEELQTPERLFFQIEQAWWFYEDFVADKYGHLPHYKNMEVFARKLFTESSILYEYMDKLDQWLKVFKEYLQRIPVYGAILLSPDMTQVLMVTGYHRDTWGFPKGKVNQGE
jgi:mRNA-decapping enzyme subunit 2